MMARYRKFIDWDELTEPVNARDAPWNLILASQEKCIPLLHWTRVARWFSDLMDASAGRETLNAALRAGFTGLRFIRPELELSVSRAGDGLE